MRNIYLLTVVFVLLSAGSCGQVPTDKELAAAEERVARAKSEQERQAATADLVRLNATRDRNNAIADAGEGVINSVTYGVGGSVVLGLLTALGLVNRKKDTETRIATAGVLATEAVKKKMTPEQWEMFAEILVQYQEQLGVRQDTRVKRASVLSDGVKS